MHACRANCNCWLPCQRERPLASINKLLLLRPGPACGLLKKARRHPTRLPNIAIMGGSLLVVHSCEAVRGDAPPPTSATRTGIGVRHAGACVCMGSTRHMPREVGLHIWLGHPMVGPREGDLVLPVYSLACMHAPRWTGAGLGQLSGAAGVEVHVVRYFAGQGTPTCFWRRCRVVSRSGCCPECGYPFYLSVSWAAAVPDGRVRAVDAESTGKQPYRGAGRVVPDGGRRDGRAGRGEVNGSALAFAHRNS